MAKQKSTDKAQQGQQTEAKGASSGQQAESKSSSSQQGSIELAALKVMARLDLEAAAAYEVAAQASELSDVRDQLMQFREDHLRHVDELAPFVQKMGGQPLHRNSNVATSLLRELAQMAEPLGATGALLMMLGNEDVTNGAYQAVMAFEWDAEVFEVLQRNQADEQRHLNWLSDREEQLGESSEEERPSPA